MFSTGRFRAVYSMKECSALISLVGPDFTGTPTTRCRHFRNLKVHWLLAALFEVLSSNPVVLWPWLPNPSKRAEQQERHVAKRVFRETSSAVGAVSRTPTVVQCNVGSMGNQICATNQFHGNPCWSVFIFHWSIRTWLPRDRFFYSFMELAHLSRSATGICH